MDKMMFAGLFYAVLLGLCWWRPAAARVVIGVFFMVMGLVVNGLVATVAPSLLVDLARQAPWEWYRDVGLAVAGPWPRGFGAVMVVFEVAIGVSILSRNRVARIAGLLIAAAFLIGITPLGIYTLVNPLLAAGCGYLAWHEWRIPTPRQSVGPGPVAPARSST